MSEEWMTRSRGQNELATVFESLHGGPRILVLPNVWDAASARVFEEAGFAAVGTTSAGVAWSLGHPDGERLGRDEMVEAIRRIAQAVAVPVTADVEGGYGRTVEEVAETIGVVVRAGAVGVNLEDGTGEPGRPLRDVDEQVERIREAREAAAWAGVEILVNARTDVYWSKVGEESERLGLAVWRANTYRQAGADCLFIPGVGDADTIGTLVQEIEAPLNVLAGPGVPPVSELEELGVARVSIGSGVARAALGLTRRVARELVTSGTYESFIEGAIPYGEANRLLSGSPERGG